MNSVDCFCDMCGKRMRTSAFCKGENYCRDCQHAIAEERRWEQGMDEKQDIYPQEDNNYGI